MTKALHGNWNLGAAALLGLVLMVGLPNVLDLYDLLQVTVYIIYAILGSQPRFHLGLWRNFVLGHSAFFGLGAYTYAIAAINIGESTAPMVMAILLPAGLASGLGYFMFYGRISDVYVGVITLTLTLIFYNVVNSTAGAEYHIGGALIGGYNGIPNIPSLNFPLSPDDTLDPTGMFILCMAVLMVVYLGLHGLLATRFGRVLVAIRENEQQVEFLGYDARLHKLVAFSVGGAIAGLAGCLFRVGAITSARGFSASSNRRRSSFGSWSAASVHCSARCSALWCCHG